MENDVIDNRVRELAELKEIPCKGTINARTQGTSTIP